MLTSISTFHGTSASQLGSPIASLPRMKLPCATSLMSLDLQNESLVISSVPHSDLSSCAKQGPTTWRLLDDGFSVSWRLHQNKVNKAHALVYEANKNLAPPSVDAFAK